MVMNPMHSSRVLTTTVRVLLAPVIVILVCDEKYVLIMTGRDVSCDPKASNGKSNR